MSQDHPKSLTAPLSFLAAIIVAWVVSLHWTTESMAPFSIIAVFIAVTPPIWIAVGRLDDQICHEARERNKEWWEGKRCPSRLPYRTEDR